MQASHKTGFCGIVAHALLLCSQIFNLVVHLLRHIYPLTLTDSKNLLKCHLQWPHQLIYTLSEVFVGLIHVSLAGVLIITATPSGHLLCQQWNLHSIFFFWDDPWPLTLTELGLPHRRRSVCQLWTSPWWEGRAVHADSPGHISWSSTPWSYWRDCCLEIMSAYSPLSPPGGKHGKYEIENVNQTICQTKNVKPKMWNWKCVTKNVKLLETWNPNVTLCENNKVSVKHTEKQFPY